MYSMLVSMETLYSMLVSIATLYSVLVSMETLYSQIKSNKIYFICPWTNNPTYLNIHMYTVF